MRPEYYEALGVAAVFLLSAAVPKNAAANTMIMVAPEGKFSRYESHNPIRVSMIALNVEYSINFFN